MIKQSGNNICFTGLVVLLLATLAVECLPITHFLRRGGYHAEESNDWQQQQHRDSWKSIEESQRLMQSSSGMPPIPLHWNLLIVTLLVSMSAMFSGLTLGLMGLDKTGLEIVMSGDDAQLAKAAKSIYPVRSDGNLLLCTLLLGNVAVNSLLSILMADLTSGMVGFVVSTGVIVVFGEILPQAACSRYALQIGMRAVPIVKIFLLLLWPIAKPMALALDFMLGRELGILYSKSELSKLLEIQVRDGGMDKDTGLTMRGALKYQDVKCADVMTALDDVFMLNADDTLDHDMLVKIFKAGYSRIPVFEVSRTNVIGLIFVKDLIFIDKESSINIRSLMQIFGRGLFVVWVDDKLGDVLSELKKGRSHMALVKSVNTNDSTGKDPYYEIKGIITLEDIIEVILGDEILDETDDFVDTNNRKVSRTDLDWARLKLLHSDITAQRLSHDEVNALSAHLRCNHSQTFSFLSDNHLRQLIASTHVTEYDIAHREIGMDIPSPDKLLYESGVPADKCTIILSGKITVLAGRESIRSDVSNWSVLASLALSDSNYAPDFTAYSSSSPCRCVCISRDDFMMAMDASAELRLNIQYKDEKRSQQIQSIRKLNDGSNSKLVISKSGSNSKIIVEERQESVTSISDPCIEDSKIEITSV